MKKLSEIKALDAKTLGQIAKIIGGIDLNVSRADPDKIADCIKTIAKKETRPLKSRVIMDYEDRITIPMLDVMVADQVPPYLPFWVMPNSGNSRTVVNITRYARVDKKTKEINVYPKTLFGLLMAGSIMTQLQQNEAAIMGSTKLLTSLAQIYSRIFTKILDKNFAISSNEVYLDQIRYLTAKFLLLSVIGRPDTPNTSEIAAKTIMNSSKSLVMQVDAQMPPGSYTDILTFIEGLKSIYKRLNRLTYRMILGDLVKLYSATSFLMLEYLPYFIANIMYSTLNAGVNNEYSFEAVNGKDGIAIYQELARLM